jgi:hypothetical protein
MSINGNENRWQDLDSFMRLYRFVEQQAAMETGAVSLRVYAKNGGRG